MTNTYIRVRLAIPGTHYWADAPEPVEFLQHEHRHMFNITVTKRVGHGNRESEFFIEREVIATHLHRLGIARDGIIRFGQQSCEHIATGLLSMLNDATKASPYESVIVSEDGENEAEVTL